MVQENKFRFNITVFFISFIVGIFYVYISSPPKKHIIKYPTPFNSGKITYKSVSGECYKYNVEEIKCDKKSIPQPIV